MNARAERRRHQQQKTRTTPANKIDFNDMAKQLGCPVTEVKTALAYITARSGKPQGARAHVIDAVRKAATGAAAPR